MLSIGLEKLHKLALGLLDLDRDGTWPSKAVMVKHGHGRGAMHEELVPALRAGAETKSPYVRDLLLVVETDPVLSPVVAALDMYGRTAVAVCGRHGLLGETGKTFGFEVHPDAVGPQVKTFG